MRGNKPQQDIFESRENHSNNGGEFGSKYQPKKGQADEYRETQSDATIQKDTFVTLMKAHAQGEKVRASEHVANIYDGSDKAIKDLKEEVIEGQKVLDEYLDDLNKDPYNKFVLDQYNQMSEDQKGLLIASAKRQLFSTDELQAFKTMVLNLNFNKIAPETVFFTSYLKVVVSQMSSEQKIGLMHQIDADSRNKVLAVMKSMHMMTQAEIDGYILSLNINADAQIQHKNNIELESKRILDAIKNQDNLNKTYRVKKVEKPQGYIARKHTINNALKGVGLFVGGTTFITNTGESIGLFARGKYEEAFYNVINHPYIPISIAAMTGFKRSLNRRGRPNSELIYSGDSLRLNNLIEQGVVKNAFPAATNESFCRVMNSTFSRFTRDQIDNNIRGKDIKEVLPRLAQMLSSKLDKMSKEQRIAMTNSYIDIWRSLRIGRFDSPREMAKMVTFYNKNYTKFFKRKKLIAEDEKPAKFV